MDHNTPPDRMDQDFSCSPLLKFCILIIEPELHFRKELSAFLYEQGHTIYEAASDKEGLEILLNTHCDLVFLDFSMHDNSGITALQKIKETYSEVEVVITYKHKQTRAIKLAIYHGALDYVEKPMRKFEVMVSMERISKFLCIHKKIKEAEDSSTIFNNNLKQLLHYTPSHPKDTSQDASI